MSAILDKTVAPVALEIIRLFPDGLVIASGLFALFTLSYPHAILFGSMIEASLVYRLLRSVGSFLNLAGGVATPTSFTDKCRSGFTGGDFSTLSLFGGNTANYPWPSFPLFMLSTAAAYLFSSLSTLSKELEALGPAYSAKYYVSLIFLGLLLLLFTTFRLVYSCDTVGTLLTTLPLGIILGLLLVQQNSRLFGRDAINLVGVPILRNRAANGQALYVCPKNPKSN
jgi:hypothetical protein